MMRMFGYKRKRNRSMTYSVMGVAASAAAAYMFRNRMGNGMKQLFQNTNRGTKFNKPMASGITEFAKEITSGLGSKNTNNNNQGIHSTSSTNPENSQIISQIASATKETGNSQQVEQLTEQLIKRNQ